MAILPMENPHAETTEGISASHGGRTRRAGTAEAYLLEKIQTEELSRQNQMLTQQNGKITETKSAVDPNVA